MAETPITVLLVEDSPTQAELVKTMLVGKSGVPLIIEWVERLSAALTRLARGGIDVVLLDLMLPDGSGVEMVTTVLRPAPTVPVIVLTGTFPDETIALEALRRGAQDYLFKDEVEPHDLLRAIHHAIERRRVLTALQQKIEELERLTRIMLDREERILALKEEAKALRAQLAAAPPRS